MIVIVISRFFFLLLLQQVLDPEYMLYRPMQLRSAVMCFGLKLQFPLCIDLSSMCAILNP